MKLHTTVETANCLIRWEGVIKPMSQKTCQVSLTIHGFRVKSMECKRPAAAAVYISPFFYFPESSLLS